MNYTSSAVYAPNCTAVATSAASLMANTVTVIEGAIIQTGVVLWQNEGTVLKNPIAQTNRPARKVSPAKK